MRVQGGLAIRKEVGVKMRKIKNFFFIFSIIFGIIGIGGLTYVYYSNVVDNLLFFLICQCVAIVFSWSFVILQYWSNGYFKRKKEKKNV